MKYVNMETNTCVFGYGCVAVHAFMNYFQFSEIRPPAEVGSTLVTGDSIKIGDWEYTGNKITINFGSYREAQYFCDSLKIIEDNHGGSFEFKSIKFDFNEYNQGSIEVMKRCINLVKNSLLMAIAC